MSENAVSTEIENDVSTMIEQERTLFWLGVEATSK